MKIELLGQGRKRYGGKATRWYRVASGSGRTVFGPATFEECRRWTKEKGRGRVESPPRQGGLSGGESGGLRRQVPTAE